VITFHVDTSTVVIDNVSFPACGLLCPQPGDRYEAPRDRLLGDSRWTRFGRQHLCHFYVPMENGALAAICGAHPTRRGVPLYDVELAHLMCKRSDDVPEDWLWMPTDMALAGDVIRPYRALPHRPRPRAIWYEAEEDWVAEHIQRLAVKRVDPPFPDDGPHATPLPLSVVAALHEAATPTAVTVRP
jgi:hypothetical protein